MENMLPWTFDGKPFTDDMIEDNYGFVYIIKNLDTGKLYIGKKGFYLRKRYQKNKKRKFKLVESDWKTYTGSNDVLNEDVNSGHKLEREILHLCRTKSEMSYLECKEQFLRDVLLSDEYYNQWIQCKIRKSHLTKMQLT
jgi:hypothetical protein